MGLKLPTGRTRDKAIYTRLELGLLVVTFFLDNRTGFFPLLGLIIVIRSCLYFQQVGPLIVAGLVFIASLLMLFLGMPPPPPPRHGIPSESIATTILTLNLNTAVSFGLTLLFILLLVKAGAMTDTKIRLLLVDDQMMIRQGLRSLLEAKPDLEVVGEAENGQ